MPILQSFGKWMKDQYIQVLPKSVIGKALAYSIERWNEPSMYTTDGKLNIDNNPVEVRFVYNGTTVKSLLQLSHVET